MPEAKIAPSMLSSDFANLAVEATRMTKNGADWLHLDCHMMVAKPEQWVDDIAKAGGQMYTFHIETTHEPVKLIKQIHAAGMKAGVAIKPKTPADSVIGEIAELADMVLVMTVEPGFGGQRFMAECMPKVELLRSKYPHLDIEVDGGLSLETIDASADAGANVIVAGTGVFKAEDPSQVISTFRQKVNTAQAKLAGAASN
ncbi:unnamed protein product [Umbelopsis sp. WA50703]